MNLVPFLLLFVRLQVKASDFCNRDDCKTACKIFRKDDYTTESPSFLYGKPLGRLGNHLNGYGLLYQMGKFIGAETYINSETKSYLTNFFEEGAVKLPVFEEVFCNPEDIPWEQYNKDTCDLLQDKSMWKGKFIEFSPEKNGRR